MSLLSKGAALGALVGVAMLAGIAVEYRFHFGLGAAPVPVEKPAAPAEPIYHPHPPPRRTAPARAPVAHRRPAQQSEADKLNHQQLEH